MRPRIVLIFSLFPVSGLAQSPAPAATLPLVIDAGSPVRVYLTKRLPKKEGAPVQAKLFEPLFAFDREVAPAGAEVLGRVNRIEGVSKTRRLNAILGGDFTPLHVAEIEFDTLVLPDGRRIALRTKESQGLTSLVPLHPRKVKSPAQNNGGVLGTAKEEAHAQVEAVKQQVQDLKDMVRGPDKKERLEDFICTKMPYHPQWVRRGTRFDAELLEPLQFGSETVPGDAMRLAGTQPAPDSIAHVRILTALSSKETQKNAKVVAALTQPLFSSDHKLIFPEGTRLTGSVIEARQARWFHRGGRLRFNFQGVELPSGIAKAPAAVTRTEASVSDVELAGTGKVKVDSEGGISSTESKTRFIAPALSLVIANRAADNDAGRVNGGNRNEGGRTAGGASGFGTLGAAAAQASRTVGTVFGFWGLAVSVYTNIIAKGSEAEFEQNAAMEVRFGARPAPRASKFTAGAY
ncbi:MAG TPA: hypothetical protein VGL72_10685 [Bryobacteraceae bacterium]|jgi:hypothetical protein